MANIYNREAFIKNITNALSKRKNKDVKNDLKSAQQSFKSSAYEHIPQQIKIVFKK